MEKANGSYPMVRTMYPEKSQRAVRTYAVFNEMGRLGESKSDSFFSGSLWINDSASSTSVAADSLLLHERIALR